MSQMTRTIFALEQGIADDSHLGAQIYISLNGRVVLDIGIGEARFGVPMRSDSIVWWLSAVKPVTAVAIAQLWERGKLELDDRIAPHIPEFAAGGKEKITIRHLLTHTGGFRGVSSNASPDPWDQIIAAICAARIEPHWIPGQKAGYHLASSWLILAEIVRRLDGRMIDRYARQEIFEPLMMNDSWIGIPRDRIDAYGDRIASTYSTEKVPPNPSDPPPTADFLSMVRPGGNGRGPVRELARLLRDAARPGDARWCADSDFANRRCDDRAASRGDARSHLQARHRFWPGLHHQLAHVRPGNRSVWLRRSCIGSGIRSQRIAIDVRVCRSGTGAGRRVGV